MNRPNNGKKKNRLVDIFGRIIVSNWLSKDLNLFFFPLNSFVYLPSLFTFRHIFWLLPPLITTPSPSLSPIRESKVAKNQNEFIFIQTSKIKINQLLKLSEFFFSKSNVFERYLNLFTFSVLASLFHTIFSPKSADCNFFTNTNNHQLNEIVKKIIVLYRC